MVGQPDLAVIVATIAGPFAIAGGLWLLGWLASRDGDDEDAERVVPEAPNHQSRVIPGSTEPRRTRPRL